jgi:3-isopropylmalate/(R)-2-methylmalate dehydratase large subunit
VTAAPLTRSPGATIAEKIIARHAERDLVRPGEYVWVRTDAAGGLPYRELDRLGVESVHAPARTFVVEDHLAPPPTDERANEMVARRAAVRRFKIDNFFEYGRHGILHQLFAEEGMFAPGELVVMRDSHATSGGVFNACVTSSTTDNAFVHALGVTWRRVPQTQLITLTGSWLQATDQLVMGKDVILSLAGSMGTDGAIYDALEVVGPAVAQMSLSSRWTIANMAVELGAKFCLFEYDAATAEFLRDRIGRPFSPVSADPDAGYSARVELDVETLEPMVALPPDPGNVATISEVAARRIRIDQAFIGSCTNGRLEDYVIAARILNGRRIDPRVRLLCNPASQRVWQEVLRAGAWEVIAEAGGNIGHSTCGPCIGGHAGVLGDGEVSISSTNRNFQGRQGSAEAEIYLANPAVVAASAVAGYIADPREML